MWLVTVKGFFSVVTDNQREGRMVIRARCKADIHNLFESYRVSLPSIEKPTSSESQDYRWRMSISKPDWIELAARLAGEIEYTNFKSTVHERPDQHNKDRAYLEIWGVMHRVQVAEPAPRKRKRKSRKRTR